MLLSNGQIWQAIKKRRVYATTFARIFLKTKIGEHFMGEEIEMSQPPKLEIDVIGTSQIASIEIYNGPDSIYKKSFDDKLTAMGNKKFIKLVWEGVMTTGRRKSTDWSGSFSIDQGKIDKVEPFAFDRLEQGITNKTNQWIEWTSTTSGDLDGLFIVLDAPDDALLSFNTKPVSCQIKLSDLSAEPTILSGGGVNLNASISLASDDFYLSDTATSSALSQTLSFTDEAIKEGHNAYWVKVLQKDGHMAWSSPIFVNFKK